MLEIYCTYELKYSKENIAIDANLFRWHICNVLGLFLDCMFNGNFWWIVAGLHLFPPLKRYFHYEIKKE